MSTAVRSPLTSTLDPPNAELVERAAAGEAAAWEHLVERYSALLDGMYAAPGLTEGVAVCGPPEACAEQLHDLVAMGARELLLNPMYDHLEQLEALATVAELVQRSRT